MKFHRTLPVAAALAALVLSSSSARAQQAPASSEDLYAPQLLMAGLRDRAALEACYRANRTVFRRLSNGVRFVRGAVTPDGRLRFVAIEPASTVPAAARRCVLAVVARWRVTPPVDGRETPLRIDVEGIRGAAGLVGG